MSDSEVGSESESRVPPPDSQLEQALRAVVRDALAAGKEITVNSARARAEEDLELDDGFFKTDSDWKVRSRDIINAAVTEAEEAKEEEEEVAAKPKAGTKRKSTASEPPAKKSKKAKREETPMEEDESASEEIAPTKKGGVKKNGTKSASTKAKPAPKSEDDSELSEPPPGDDEEEEEFSEAPPVKKQKKKAESPAPIADESEMSDVIDDGPPKKKRGNKKSTSPRPPTKAKPKATKPKPDPKTLSADEEEIKRLQGWLLKCGIRKLWHRELAAFDSNKDKIRHLKGILTDVGMTGRFSVEKARGIKESRELAAELEAAQEFNEHWGDGNADEGENGDSGGAGAGAKKIEDGARNRRAKPKGLIVFSDSDDDDD